MRLTPLDIRKQPFRKTMMGFDRDQVNSFLYQVAGEFEQLNKKNDELSASVKILQERLDIYEKIEKTLNETLITAQRATDEAKLNAQREAELIIKDAQVRADQYEDRSRRKVNDLEADSASLRTQRDSFLARFKSMLRDQLALLDVVSGSIKDRDEDDPGRSRKRERQASAIAGGDEELDDETMDEVPPHPVV